MGDEKDSSNVLKNILKNILFLKIFQTFRMAIQPSKLIIAFCAVTGIYLAGSIMDFSNTVRVQKGIRGKVMQTELDIYMTRPELFDAFIKGTEKSGVRTGVFSTLWHFGSKKYHDALDRLFAFDLPGVMANMRDFFKAVTWAVRHHSLYCILFFLIQLVVFSIAGGAICRISALQFAQDEKPGLTEALRFSINKFTSLVTSPLLPMVIIIIIGLFISLLGLIGNIRWAGDLMVAIFTLLALIAGAFIAVASIGTVAGFSLMFPSVAYDGSDCLDAINRSFCYVYARPWRMGFYTVTAAVYGSLCYIFVRFFAFLLIWCTHLFLQLGLNDKKLAAIWPVPTFKNLVDLPDLSAANWSVQLAAVVIYMLVLAVVVLVVSFIISFYFSANTIIYSLLRKKVDNTALEDVYSPFEEVDTEPAVFEQVDTEPVVPEQVETEPTLPEQAEPEPTVPEQAEPEPTVPEQAETEPAVPEEVETEPTLPEQVETEPIVTESEPEQPPPKAKKKSKKKTKKKTKKKSKPQPESDESPPQEQ
ncbi:MAG: hypothetical protein GWN67_20215 [Phycisphaerae bacterium]|nr:hypothetical protein [Phycisphaerae bacterium]NIP54440.1 hypothetical protein [Phycisphaerae bacterium]NIS53299.1 hypothetical protein [Phycisphaerae bacterium]NIU10825.1 hypothetical protein [Phycisphaerae bacterium]NIU58620.1 hypothetical protein [Phycisphaerae bacterium]